MPEQGRTTSVQPGPSVRVFTLGRFRVEREHAPLQSGRKAQRKPIDLLKLLIAYGGEGVCAEQLAEDLWPDSDGDDALAALRTTVSRLRKLIGARAVLREGRGLTLNPDVCWVDALALGRQLAEFKRGHHDGYGGEVLAGFEDAISLYRGDFLPGECDLPPVRMARAKLHSLFLRQLGELGRCYEQAGQIARALDLYRQGLEIDGTEEEIARKLMQCCRDSGRAAEGIAVYRSCRAALRARLDVEPSAATQSAYRDLLVNNGAAG
jgi:DNA-binding SARP family transcriptional activator